MKGYITRQIRRAVRQQRVHWDRGRVVDWTVDLGLLPAKVRYVPTFAYRQLLYDAPELTCLSGTGCRLCEALGSAANEIGLPTTGDADLHAWVARFKRVFALQHNNFPYFDMQILVMRREHAPTFSAVHFELLFEFMERSGFRCAAMQAEGSGATIPDHAHVGVWDEDLPIFRLRLDPWVVVHGVTLYRVVGYPGALYAVKGGGHRERAWWVERLIHWITGAGFSYNVFLRGGGLAYLCPRKSEMAHSIQRKVGSVEVAGVYLGNALGAQTRDISELENIIRNRCDAVQSEQFLAALAETVCSWHETEFLRPLILSERCVSL